MPTHQGVTSSDFAIRVITGRPHFIALHFVVLHRVCVLFSLVLFCVLQMQVKTFHVQEDYNLLYAMLTLSWWFGAEPTVSLSMAVFEEKYVCWNHSDIGLIPVPCLSR